MSPKSGTEIPNPAIGIAFCGKQIEKTSLVGQDKRDQVQINV